MRILLLNQFFYPDSAATSQLLTDLARSLAAQGHSVRVICGRSSYAEPDALNPPAVEIVRTPGLPFGRGLLARTFSYTGFLAGAGCRGLLGPRPHLILTLTTPPALSVVGSLLKTVFRARHFIWEMDLYPDIAVDLEVLPPRSWFPRLPPPPPSAVGSLPKPLSRPRHFIWEMDLYPDIAVDLEVLHPRSWFTRLMGASFDHARRKADGIIALGECMRQRLIRRGIPPERIHVADNWADGAEIQPLPFPAPSPLRILYWGNLGLAHDVDTIRAAIHHFRSDPRFHFAFAGAGLDRQALEFFCADMGVGEGPLA